VNPDSLVVFSRHARSMYESRCGMTVGVATSDVLRALSKHKGCGPISADVPETIPGAIALWVVKRKSNGGVFVVTCKGRVK
jgi:hypothetical protein